MMPVILARFKIPAHWQGGRGVGGRIRRERRHAPVFAPVVAFGALGGVGRVVWPGVGSPGRRRP